MRMALLIVASASIVTALTCFRSVITESAGSSADTAEAANNDVVTTYFPQADLHYSGRQTQFGGSYTGTLTAPATSWTMLGGDPGRMCALAPSATSSPGAATAGPLVAGSLKAYPNPARRKPIQFAYQLSEDAAVEFRILDTSGHEVARWSRSGRRSDNLETWDPSGVPAGLYVARVRFSGPGGAHTESLPLGVLR